MRGVLVDTSAWIEFLRATGSATDLQLVGLLETTQTPLFATGVVVQEVLQGCRDESHAAEVRKLLQGCQPVEPVYPETFEHAAALYRLCRKAGQTVRGTVDCLVAALALEQGLELLANDRDFKTLHRLGGLVLAKQA